MKSIKIMISQPMNGLTDEQIKKERNNIIRKFQNMNIYVLKRILKIDTDEEIEIEFIASIFDDEVNAKYYKSPALYYLALSIDVLGQADFVYFTNGWEKARGCVIERKVCESYNINIIDEIEEHKLIIEDIKEDK